MKNNFKFKLLTFFVLVFLIISCKDKPIEKKEQLRPVKYLVIGDGESKNTRTFSGFARIGDDVTLSFRTDGIIVQKNAANGQFVKKGTLLGKLDFKSCRKLYRLVNRVTKR